MLVAATLTALVGGLIYWLSYGCYNYWKKRGVPQPPTLPIVGNVGNMVTFKKSFGEVYRNMYNDFKGYNYVGCYNFFTPDIMLRDVELIKTVLVKEFSSFHDNAIEIDEKLDPLFGRNPFVLKGSRWKAVRTQVTSAITIGKIKKMFTLMENVCKSMVTYLNKEPEATGVHGLDAKELSAKYTTDVVAACAFGLDGNTFTDPNSEFRQMGKKLFEPSLIFAIKTLISFVIPSLKNLFKFRLVSVELHNWFTGILQETIKYREKNNVVRNDYLDMMLSLKNKPGEYEFTDMDIMAQSMSFYSDGFETSAVALSFTLYEIAKNPDVQEKLQKEIERIIAKHNNEITYDAIQEMQYLDMVIHETLRKYPPGTALRKSCTERFEMPPPRGEGTGPSVIIEPGTVLIIPILALHYDPAFYPDPEKFIPERFTEEQKSARPKCSFIPFGEGPRMCLGFRFALVQIKAAVAATVTNFEIKVNPKTTPTFEIDPKPFMIAKKGGIWLNFYKRSK